MKFSEAGLHLASHLEKSRPLAKYLSLWGQGKAWQGTLSEAGLRGWLIRRVCPESDLLAKRRTIQYATLQVPFKAKSVRSPFGTFLFVANGLKHMVW